MESAPGTPAYSGVREEDAGPSTSFGGEVQQARGDGDGVKTVARTVARKPPGPSQPTPKRSKPPPPAQTKKRRREQGVPEPPEPKGSFKGIFAKDLGDIMYGYGDSTTNPVPETVEAVEHIAIEFVRDILTKCLDTMSGKGKLDVHDLQFVLRKDVRKAQRAAELVIAKERTKKFKNVGKGDNFDVEDIQDSVMVHDDG